MLKSEHEADVFYFLNSLRGRAAQMRSQKVNGASPQEYYRRRLLNAQYFQVV